MLRIPVGGHLLAFFVLALAAGPLTACDDSGTKPNCQDGVQNAEETDVDCGGGACVACEVGLSCVEGGDCASGVCGTEGTCGCADGYADDGAGGCADVDECAEGTDGCADGMACVNTDGGFTCEDVDECADGTHDCGTAGICLNTVGGFLCDDVDECAEGTDGCDLNATCENTAGAFTCTCNGGYSGDGVTCADDDECADGTDDCDPNATCANTNGGFSCTCDAGYQGPGTSCYDIDECTTGGQNCDANATCTNTPGGFTCTCNPPLVGDGTVCVDPADCTPDPSICAANATCTDMGGYANCLCDVGYEGDGLTCADVDECSNGTNGCHADATCTNNSGGFDCACDAGYSGDGVTCTDDDECTLGTDGCHADAICTNTPGSFVCTCNTGYSGDGLTCGDDDECTLATHNCDANATCTNTAGGFNCSCNTGYSGDGLTCTDIDECALAAHNCDANAICTNTAGGYSCACPPGTIDVNGDGTACEYYQTCYDIMVNEGPGLPDGPYIIDVDGSGWGLQPFGVYCDMTTNGGGWTIVYAASGANGEQPLVSDTEVAGDPLAFDHFNLNRTQKMAIANLSFTSMFVSSSGAWLQASRPLFDDSLDTPDSEGSYPVHLRANDGTVDAQAFMGWSNFNISGGGDFSLSTGPVDHHSSNYWRLNGGCVDHYLYSYSFMSADGDAGYDINTALGSWVPTVSCESAEGGQLAFYVAMGRGGTYPATCAEALAEDPTATDGIYLIKPPGVAPFQVYCDMSTDAGGWTMVLRLNSNDPTTQQWSSSFWSSLTEIGSLAGDADYLSPSYDILTNWDQILVDYRYATNRDKRMAAVFEGTNSGTFRSHTTQALDNNNPDWTRLLVFDNGVNADAANWYGGVLKFQTIGNGGAAGNDSFRIWYNQVLVSACNQAGGIGGQGDGGDWYHELSFPSADPGCQENEYRGTIGINGGGSLMTETLLSPADAYDNGLMLVFVR